MIGGIDDFNTFHKIISQAVYSATVDVVRSDLCNVDALCIILISRNVCFYKPVELPRIYISGRGRCHFPIYLHFISDIRDFEFDRKAVLRINLVGCRKGRFDPAV